MRFFLLCLAVNPVHGKKAGYQTHHDILTHSVTETCLHCPLLPELLFSSSFGHCVVLFFCFVFGHRVSLAGLELVIIGRVDFKLVETSLPLSLMFYSKKKK